MAEQRSIFCYEADVMEGQSVQQSTEKKGIEMKAQIQNLTIYPKLN